LEKTIYIDFGPQLIGQTEKTLSALLRAVLGDRLTEPQWVTLRLAQMLEPQIADDDELARAVTDRAHFSDAPDLVQGLGAAGLLRDGRLTEDGNTAVSEILERITERVEPVWEALPADDVASAARVLNEVLQRARAALS
jgi:hypothetical protein